MDDGFTLPYVSSRKKEFERRGKRRAIDDEGNNFCNLRVDVLFSSSAAGLCVMQRHRFLFNAARLMFSAFFPITLT